jgi:hypothetical protein
MPCQSPFCRTPCSRLRAEGHPIDDATLAVTTPLLREHLNPFGRYDFDLGRPAPAPR